MPPGGTLFVVATPIGNLEDITFRALKVLKTVRLVAAEDTRRTGNLLRHFEIEVPIISVREHNERASVPKVTARLEKGESVALVTDAGTPGVSDPGAAIVSAVRERGFRVEPIPGASAVSAAISASGFRTEGFTFLGFPPIKAKDRTRWFTELVSAAEKRAVVMFEAPHRVKATLSELNNLVDRPILLARELTKLHEEILLDRPINLIDRLEPIQGEFTLVIPPGLGGSASALAPEDSVIADVFGQITETQRPESKRDAARLVGEKLGISAKAVYEALERVKIGQ